MSPTAASGPAGTGRERTGTASWSALTRVGWRACLVGVVGVALLGALFSSALTTLVIAPAAGLFGAAQLAVVHPSFPDRRSARRAVLLSGFGWALFIPFVMGAVALGVVGGVLTVVLVLLGALVLMGRVIDLCRSDAVSNCAGTDVLLLRELVRGLPTPALLEEWRSAEAVLDEATDPGRRAAAIQLRVLLLEEMSRRDPAGIERWLQEGAGGLPDRHIRRDTGSAPI
jgi:MFS family permease